VSPGAPEPSDVLLADGGSARLRAIRPEDAQPLAAFHRALSDETRHFRYFSGLGELPPLILRRFTQVDFARDMVLVAELGERIIALASYHRGANPADTAEVAFVVADEHQGRGLGTLLLERLAELGRARGIVRFRADTLAGNRAMLRVFRDAGFELAREPDRGVIHLRFPVEETPRARAAHEEREHLAEARSMARLLAPRAILLSGARRTDAARLRAQGYRGEIRLDDGAAVDGIDLVLHEGPATDVRARLAAWADADVHALALGELDGEPEGPEREVFERELAMTVRRNGMRLLGPGSLGLANTSPEVALCAAPRAEPPPRGALGLACETPEQATALLDQAAKTGTGLSTFVAMGRRADVSVNDLLQYWLDDPATRVVGLALASCGNPRKFERIAARLAARKPLIAVSSGDAARDALLDRVGAERVPDVETLLAAARRRSTA
jgi:RimJ/RimL family protein N-acetyltransferase